MGRSSVSGCVPPRQTLGKEPGFWWFIWGCFREASEEVQSLTRQGDRPQGELSGCLCGSRGSVPLGPSEELQRDTSGPSSWWLGGRGLDPPALTAHSAKGSGPSTWTSYLPTGERASVLLEKARRQRRRKWTFHSLEECRDGPLPRDNPDGPRGHG